MQVTIETKNVISIVFDYKKNKYRAQAQDGSWVRFSNALRVPNAIYHVESLQPARGNSYIAKGKIVRIK